MRPAMWRKAEEDWKHMSSRCPVLALLVACSSVGAPSIAVPADYAAQEVQAVDNVIECISYRDWLVTTISGPRSDFQAPTSIAVGQTFSASGSTRTIKFIVASQVEADYVNKRFSMKKGEWYCRAAETRSDLDNEANAWKRTWLLVPKCLPIR
jgi:hypothetical protein